MTTKEIGVLVLIIILMLSLLGGFAFFFFRYKRSVKEDSDKGEYDLDLLTDFKRETNPKVKKKKSAFRIIRKTLSITLIVIISALLVIGICDKFGLLKIGSKSIIVVASGSMSRKHPDNEYLVENDLNDQFPTFSIIVIERVNPDILKQYDTIVYKDDHGTNIVHRIKRIAESSSGRQYITRGDANNTDDTFVATAKDIQGKYTGVYVPVIGAIVLFIQSALGMATMVALIVGLILVDNTKNKIFAIHGERLDYLLETLSLDEEKIQAIEESDLKNLLDNSEVLKKNSENTDEETVSDEQKEKEINQNDKNDNTNND